MKTSIRPSSRTRAPRARLACLVVTLFLAALAPRLRASEGEVSLTRGKLLAERGRHEEAARLFERLATDATVPADERARALVHMGLALEAAKDLPGAADAYARVLPTARTEEIVALLVEAVTHVVPRPGQLSDRWQRIEVDVEASRPAMSHATIRWPEDRMPEISRPEDGFFGLSLMQDAALADALRVFSIGGKQMKPAVVVDATACASLERVSTSSEMLEWASTLRAIVNLYDLHAVLAGDTLRISCADPGPGASGTGPAGETSLTLFVGVPTGSVPVAPCTGSVESLTIASTDEAGLAELDAMIRRQVGAPAAIRICGVASAITRVADLVGHLEGSPARYATVDLKEVWAMAEGARFSVTATVVGGF